MKKISYFLLFAITLVVLAIPRISNTAEMEDVCLVDNIWYLKYTAIEEKTDDIRRFLVPAFGQGSPPNADEYITTYDKHWKAGRPGVGPIPNAGGSGNGKIDPGTNLCGSKWDTATTTYITDTDFITDANTTYEGLHLKVVRGIEKPRTDDVWIQVDTATTVEFPKNGRSFDAWDLIDDDDPA